jgi:hypothetical protein
VFGALPPPRDLCPDCGARVAEGLLDAHACAESQLLDVRLLQLRDEIEAFDDQLSAWLRSAAGRFAAWIAERDRRAGPSGPPAAAG